MRLMLLLFLAGGVQPDAPPGFRWKNAPPAAGVPHQPRPQPGPALGIEGARLYEQSCAACHGDAGRGDGLIAARLATPPRDFTRGVYKVRSTPSGSLPTDRDLFETISRGMHGTEMTPWVRLSERQRWALVAHLKSLSPRFRSEGQEPAIAVPAPPAGRAKLRKHGETLYWRLQCNNCHGPAGRGDGPAVLEYARAPERVRIRDLAGSPFLRGATPRDIYLSLRTGLDGTPMGAFDLPEEELWSLAFYVSDVLRRAPPPSSRAGGEHGDGDEGDSH
jgi:mono/diheme cytochrome c family protein